MLKFHPSHVNPLSVISVRFKKASAQWLKSFAQKQVTPVSLVTVLGVASVGWLTTSAIAPQSAHAYTARVDVTLNRQTGESYQSFLRRAEAVARAAAQRSFDQDILVTDVAVTILGQNDGAIVPVLSLDVTRQSWRNRPDPQIWATYLPNTQSLLGFDESDVAADLQPTEPGTNVPQPPPVPQPGTPQIIEIPGTPIRIQNPAPAPGVAPQPDGSPAPGTPPTPGTTPPPGTPSTPQVPGTTPPGTPGVSPTQQAPGTTPSGIPGVSPTPQTPGTTPSGTPGGSPTQQTPATTPQPDGVIEPNIPGAPIRIIPNPAATPPAR